MGDSATSAEGPRDTAMLDEPTQLSPTCFKGDALHPFEVPQSAVVAGPWSSSSLPQKASKGLTNTSSPPADSLVIASLPCGHRDRTTSEIPRHDLEVVRRVGEGESDSKFQIREQLNRQQVYAGLPPSPSLSGACAWVSLEMQRPRMGLSCCPLTQEPMESWSSAC